MLKGLKGTPWKFRATGGEEVESRTHVELPKIATRESGSRQLYVWRRDLENPDGATDYTPGCSLDSLMIRAPAVAHSDVQR